jgi:hypothetical protein
MLVTDSRTFPHACPPLLGRIAVTTVLAEPPLCRIRLVVVLPMHHKNTGASSRGLICPRMTEARRTLRREFPSRNPSGEDLRTPL